MVEADDVAGEDQAYNTFLEEPAILDKHKAAAVIANGKSKHKSSCTHPPYKLPSKSFDSSNQPL